MVVGEQLVDTLTPPSGGSCALHQILHSQLHAIQFLFFFHCQLTLTSEPVLSCAPLYVQVINKYGDLYGAERIAELLGLDKSALDFDPTVETVEKEASLVSW